MIPQHTSHTLLRNMNDPDEHDWDRFYEVYKDGIIAYARSCGCTKELAEDILQETMVLLIEKLPVFQYDPGKGSFRGYLRTIVRRKIYRHFERKKRRGENRLTTEWEMNLVDPDSLEDPDSDAVHWKKLLTVTALQRIEAEYKQKKWNGYEVFTDYVLRGMSATDVAMKYGIKKNNAYQIRRRILNRLATIIQHLEENGIDSIETLPPINPDEQ